MSETPNDQILIRIPTSHRKRDKLSVIGRKLECLYSFRFEGNFAYVSKAEYEQVKHLATKARVDKSKLLKCWG